MDFNLHSSLIWLVFTHGGTSPERERLRETFAQAGGGAEYLMERATQPLAPIDYPQPRHAGVQRHGLTNWWEPIKMGFRIPVRVEFI